MRAICFCFVVATSDVLSCAFVQFIGIFGYRVLISIQRTQSLTQMYGTYYIKFLYILYNLKNGPHLLVVIVTATLKLITRQRKPRVEKKHTTNIVSYKMKYENNRSTLNY